MRQIPLLAVFAVLAVILAAQHAYAQEPEQVVEIRGVERVADKVEVHITGNADRFKLHVFRPNGDYGSTEAYSPGNRTISLSIPNNGVYEWIFARDGTFEDVRSRDDTVTVFYTHPGHTWKLNNEPVIDTSNFTGHTVRVGERFDFTLAGSDEDDHELTFSTGHRNVQISGDSLQWTPEARDYRSGDPTGIRITASDNFGGATSADLQVAVHPAASFDPPSPLAAVRDRRTTIEMEPYITTNPSDITRQLSLVGTSHQDIVEITGTNVTYTPSPGRMSDSFELRLAADDTVITRTINITLIDEPAVTAVIDAARVQPSRTISIPVLDNDIVDPDVAELLITRIEQDNYNQVGRAQISNDRKEIQYRAFYLFEKTERFNYTVTATGGVESTASVVVRLSDKGGNLPPVADDITLDLARGSTVDVVTGGYIYDFNERSDGLGVSVGEASKGTPGVNGSMITYEPTGGGQAALTGSSIP